MRSEVPAPNYAERLRFVGAQLDASGYHAVGIVEVEDGLIVRASAPGSRRPEVLEIHAGEVQRRPRLSKPARKVPHRLFPGGYERFLECLGQRLDRSQAAAIAIVEGTDFVTVGGIQPVETGDDTVTYEPLDVLLLADDIERLLAEARNVPASSPAATTSQDEDAEIVQDGEQRQGSISRFASRVDSALHIRPTGQQPARARG